MPIAQWAVDYVGLPFLQHGRDRNGIDCWGLVCLVYAEHFSKDLPSLIDGYDDTKYQNRGEINRLFNDEVRNWREINSGCEQPGDVVVLKVGGVAMHVGLVIGSGNMLHIEQGINCAVERYDSIRWKHRLHGFYRHEA